MTQKQVFDKSSDPAWRERAKPTVTGTVVDVVEHAGTKDFTVIFPPDAEFDFMPADGIGVPAPVDHDTLERVIDSLKIKGRGARRTAMALIQPSEPYPAVELAEPSKALLELIAKRGSNTAEIKMQVTAKLDKKGTPRLGDAFSNAANHRTVYTVKGKLEVSDTSEDGTEVTGDIEVTAERFKSLKLKDRIPKLRDILDDPDKLERLQATYNVAEILELFPNLVTAAELAETQGPTHGNKTYTLIDRGRMKNAKGQDAPFMTFSVLPEGGLHKQNSFGGKTREALHIGETSSYLYNLDKGDRLTINAPLKHKDYFQLPDDPGKGLLFIAQGNGAATFTTLLKELQQQGEKGAHVMLAARDHDTLWGMRYLKPYLEDGTIGRLDISLSETDAKKGVINAPSRILTGDLSKAARQRITLHNGRKLVDEAGGIENCADGLLREDIAKSVGDMIENGGRVYVASGDRFAHSMAAGIAEIMRRRIHAMKDRDFVARLNATFEEKEKDTLIRLRNADRLTAKDVETFTECDLSGFAGSYTEMYSKTRVRGIEKGWSRRIAGRELIDRLHPEDPEPVRAAPKLMGPRRKPPQLRIRRWNKTAF